MNERIKEFAQQANAWYPDGYPSAEGGDEAWQNLVIFKKEDLEKFAKLIVRGCIGIALEQKKWVEDQEIFNPQDEQWNCARAQQSQRIVDKIKKHFGVE